MSYDISARSDSSYSDKKIRSGIHEKISSFQDIKINGNSGFLLEIDGMRMEVDVELVSEEGDNIENDSQKPSLEVNCINFHIGLTTEKAMLSCIDIALDIANAIGWKLYDPQTDNLITDKNSQPWWQFW
jgi:hypothetical protein